MDNTKSHWKIRVFACENIFPSHDRDRECSHKFSPTWIPKHELNKKDTNGQAILDGVKVTKPQSYTEVTKQSWEQERWSSPGKCINWLSRAKCLSLKKYMQVTLFGLKNMKAQLLLPGNHPSCDLLWYPEQYWKSNWQMSLLWNCISEWEEGKILGCRNRNSLLHFGVPLDIVLWKQQFFHLSGQDENICSLTPPFGPLVWLPACQKQSYWNKWGQNKGFF